MAQNANNGVVMMNHIAIAVPDMAEAVTHYTQAIELAELPPDSTHQKAIASWK
jgi:hypothetical protein